MDKIDMEKLRKIRAYAILAKGDTPKRVDEETFIIPSQHNPNRKYKVMRGLENVNTAREMNENLRVYYNFLRKHMALNGKTPAEEAGINLNLGRNKWMDLLEKCLSPECDKH